MAFEARLRKLPTLHEFKANALGNHYIESLNAELTGHCHRYVMGLCSSCSHGGDESFMLHLPPECFKLVLSVQCVSDELGVPCLYRTTLKAGSQLVDGSLDRAVTKHQ